MTDSWRWLGALVAAGITSALAALRRWLYRNSMPPGHPERIPPGRLVGEFADIVSYLR